MQLWTNSLTSYRESKNILIQNCQNSPFQSFYFFVSIILDLLSCCRPLAMDEYLFSSLLALWKLNQWGKKYFSIFCFALFFLSLWPPQGSSSHHPLAAAPWWTPSASLSGWTAQPFTTPSSLLCWFPPELLDRQHCLVGTMGTTVELFLFWKDKKWFICVFY